MEQYLDLARLILTEGYETGDRTGIGTIAIPGHQYRVTLDDDGDVVRGFCLHTTKNVALRLVFEELMWKLRGETNIYSLLAKNVHIWTQWPFIQWLKYTGEVNAFDWYVDAERSDYSDEFKQRMSDFEQMILNNPSMRRWGELGPTYGHQFRKYGQVINDEGYIIQAGKDQLMDAVSAITNGPESRRIIISLWNPIDNERSLLPPCPCFYQFFANQKGYLHLNMYQRSCDTLLGVPFNDAQDCLFLILMARLTGRKVKYFNHSFGDAHIYKNHIPFIEEQLERTPRELPSIRIKRKVDNILDYTWEDIELIGYDPYPKNFDRKPPIAI